MTITSESRPLDALKQHPRNYNRHSDEQIGRMADRMRHVAYTAPVIIRPDNTLLAGHLRREALLRLRASGYPAPAGVTDAWELPVRVFEGTEAQELAILAGDNPDPLDLDYDPVGLAGLLEELQSSGALESTGYDEERLRGLLAAIGEPEPDTVDSLPDPEDLGELQLADTRLVQLFYPAADWEKFHAAVVRARETRGDGDMSSIVLAILVDAYPAPD